MIIANKISNNSNNDKISISNAKSLAEENFIK